MKILGLDPGSKRIGVALSDELRLMAHGMDSIQRGRVEKDLERIRMIVWENDVSEIVVGLPVSMNGSHSAQTKEVLKFIDDLAAAVKVPVRTWDERLTSVQAERILLEADMSRAKRRKFRDKVAAKVILQSYLDSLKRREI